MKGRSYQKKNKLFVEKINIIVLSKLSQLFECSPFFEINLQDNFLGKLQNFCRVTYCASTEKSDFFAIVIISLLKSLSQ